MANPPLPRHKALARYGRAKDCKDLAGLCLDLLGHQRNTWRDLAAVYEGLEGVRHRDVACNGFSVRLQYNSGRLVNSLANVGGQGRPERPCFLCVPNLPEDQKAVLYGDDYLILCNPRPAFPGHFTVCHVRHRAQAIEGHIHAFLALMADVGPCWTCLYNGPRCGASAPDHLHFQLVPSGHMPLEEEMGQEERHRLLKRLGHIRVYSVGGLGRQVVVMEGDDPGLLGEAFVNLLRGLRKVLGIDVEPMINVAGSYAGGFWRLALFPRRKHRPDVFFKEGDERILVSPGVVEMGGVLITPVERDFERLDGPSVERIYSEVSLEAGIVEMAVEFLE